MAVQLHGRCEAAKLGAGQGRGSNIDLEVVGSWMLSHIIAKSQPNFLILPFRSNSSLGVSGICSRHGQSGSRPVSQTSPERRREFDVAIRNDDVRSIKPTCSPITAVVDRKQMPSLLPYALHFRGYQRRPAALM